MDLLVAKITINPPYSLSLVFMFSLSRFYQRLSFSQQLYIQLPLLAAIMLETHIRFLSFNATHVDIYFSTLLQLFAESVPLLISHYFAYRYKGYFSFLVWSLGFILYPVLLLTTQSSSNDIGSWPLFSVQGWVFALIASCAWFLRQYIVRGSGKRSLSFTSRIFSLNVMLVLSLMIWAGMVAGIFNSVDDPMYNQPLESIIDVERISEHFAMYMHYLWQFMFMGSLVFSVYAINRYLLIQIVLAKQGVISFLMAGLVVLMVCTPIFAQLCLLLPINTPELTMLPSADHNIFGKDNYRFMFVLLAVSTPLILAFERQQQGTHLAQAAEKQTQTELKLLQQQINPHFLFNTLNNLYALTLKKSDDSPKMVMQLSNLLRYSVYEGQKQLVTLEQEIQYLQNYIELQKIRWGKQCELKLHWPEHCKGYKIPPMLIIVILENAFKYGVEPSVEQTSVKFSLELKGNALTLECENTILPTTQAESCGVGLENLKKRLMLIFPYQHKLTSRAEGELWKTYMELELLND